MGWLVTNAPRSVRPSVTWRLIRPKTVVCLNSVNAPRRGTLAEARCARERSAARKRSLHPPEGGSAGLVKRTDTPESAPSGPPESEPTASELSARPRANRPSQSLTRPRPRAAGVRLESGTSPPEGGCCLTQRQAHPSEDGGRLASRQTVGAAPKSSPAGPRAGRSLRRATVCPSEEEQRRPQLKSIWPGESQRRHCVHKRRTSPKAVRHALSHMPPESGCNNRAGSLKLRGASQLTRPEGQVRPPFAVGSLRPESLSVNPSRGTDPTT